MTIYELTKITSVYFFIPIIGLACLLYFRDKMIRSGISNPPIIELSLVLVIYGILLYTILTGLFWRWSVSAFMGTFFSVFVAPILMVFIYVRLKMVQPSTPYHLALQKAAIWYFFAFPAGLIILFSYAKG